LRSSLGERERGERIEGKREDERMKG